MTTTDTISDIQKMHDSWCKITNRDPMARENSIRWFERSYWELLNAGFTPEDWELVVRYLAKQNREARGFEYSLKPSKLLGDMQLFCEHLGDAKRWQGRRDKLRGTPQERIVETFRGYKKPEAPITMADTTQSARDVLRKALDA